MFHPSGCLSDPSLVLPSGRGSLDRRPCDFGFTTHRATSVLCETLGKDVHAMMSHCCSLRSLTSWLWRQRQRSRSPVSLVASRETSRILSSKILLTGIPYCATRASGVNRCFPCSLLLWRSKFTAGTPTAIIMDRLTLRRESRKVA